jgi:hypothetical protein
VGHAAEDRVHRSTSAAETCCTHLLLQVSLIELSPDRAEFLSRLFSPAQTRGVGGRRRPHRPLFQAYAKRDARQRSALCRPQTSPAVKEQPVAKHKIGLQTPKRDDLRTDRVRGTRLLRPPDPDLTYSITMPGAARSQDLFYGRRMPNLCGNG